MKSIDVNCRASIMLNDKKNRNCVGPNCPWKNKHWIFHKHTMFFPVSRAFRFVAKFHCCQKHQFWFDAKAFTINRCLFHLFVYCFFFFFLFHFLTLYTIWSMKHREYHDISDKVSHCINPHNRMWFLKSIWQNKCRESVERQREIVNFSVSIFPHVCVWPNRYQIEFTRDNRENKEIKKGKTIPNVVTIESQHQKHVKIHFVKRQQNNLQSHSYVM